MKTEKMLLGAAVAGILGAFAAGSSLAADKMMDKMGKKAAKADDIQCAGVNACKGKSSCAGANSGCAGQNGCKGQGWVKVSKDACDQLGGTVPPAPKKS